MRRSILSEYQGPAIIVVFLVCMYLFLRYAGSILPGSNWSTLSVVYVTYLPYLLGFFIAFYVTYQVRSSIYVVMPVAVMGILLSLLLEEMNTNGLLVDEVITSTLTLIDIQAAVIVLFVIVGLAKAFINR